MLTKALAGVSSRKRQTAMDSSQCSVSVASPVPRPRTVLELAWRPRLPDRAEMVGMKLTMSG